MTEKREAVILGSKPLREADVLLHLATPQGRLSVVANAARRSQRRFPSGFPTGAIVEIVCSTSALRASGLLVLNDMRIHHSLLSHETLGPRLLGATGYALELVDRSWPERQESHEKFDCLVCFLRDVAVTSDPAACLLEFCWEWLALLGFRPMTEECVRCGRPTSADGNGRILTDAGGIVCADCRGGRVEGIPMSGDWRREVVRQWVAHVLDLRLKSDRWWPLIWGLSP
jgi:DNA repair protein RecO (recombination protein O)